MKLIFELDFLSISNLSFTACVACKNQVPNRQKNQAQIDRGQFQIHWPKLSHAEEKHRQKNAELSNSPVNTRN